VLAILAIEAFDRKVRKGIAKIAKTMSSDGVIEVRPIPETLEFPSTFETRPQATSSGTSYPRLHERCSQDD
jgi:hypothetical protein